MNGKKSRDAAIRRASDQTRKGIIARRGGTERPDELFRTRSVEECDAVLLGLGARYDGHPLDPRKLTLIYSEGHAPDREDGGQTLREQTLTKALEWYADPSNWEESGPAPGEMDGIVATRFDKGAIARTALGANVAVQDTERPEEKIGRIGDPYTTSDGSDDPNRASEEAPLSQRCPVNAYPGAVCDLPPGHTGLHQSGSEEERARREQLNICRCGHDIRWHRIAERVGTRMVEAGPCAHMTGSGTACSCSFFYPPSRRNLHLRGTDQEHDERIEILKAAHGAAQEILGVAERGLQEALDLLGELLAMKEKGLGHDDLWRRCAVILRKHGRLTEGDSQ